jgi:transcriptional regulator with XRE-family HTH domain
LNKEQTDITTGKQIRHLRTQSGMTQEELAGISPVKIASLFFIEVVSITASYFTAS